MRKQLRFLLLVLVLVAAILIVFDLQKVRTSSVTRLLLPGQTRLTVLERQAKPYEVGKRVVYRPIDSCPRAQFLDEYKNPCWITQGRTTCAARVMLLGFHKSGTTDMTERFTHHPGIIGETRNYFTNSSPLTEDCPLKWMETHLSNPLYLEKKKDIFCDCSGCALIHKHQEQNETYLVRQSAAQYLTYSMLDSSRYIITMREPADRTISHFFFMHKKKRANNPYNEYSLAELGNSFFHRLISESVESFTKCLPKYGTTVCILNKEQASIYHPHPYTVTIMSDSCYSTLLKELLKFIPKEKIYFSKMEDYAKDEEESIKRIFRFVGVPVIERKEVNRNDLPKVANSGYGAKPVLPETKELLKMFYEPFNVELAEMLGDDKWLWK
ncbi:carbohydrate sulfotransferase 15-like [Watersipora subatra]|uniref:carbohydrate sulfotransferase 15-like n=1 Tax=Watersipora subatra TaxID=2589382 RepID=UPI00355B6C29